MHQEVVLIHHFSFSWDSRYPFHTKHSKLTHHLRIQIHFISLSFCSHHAVYRNDPSNDTQCLSNARRSLLPTGDGCSATPLLTPPPPPSCRRNPPPPPLISGGSSALHSSSSSSLSRACCYSETPITLSSFPPIPCLVSPPFFRPTIPQRWVPLSLYVSLCSCVIYVGVSFLVLEAFHTRM